MSLVCAYGISKLERNRLTMKFPGKERTRVHSCNNFPLSFPTVLYFGASSYFKQIACLVKGELKCIIFITTVQYVQIMKC